MSGKSYLDLFSDTDLATITDWIRCYGEVFAAIEYPHSGSSGDRFFVRSIADFRTLVETRAWPEIAFSVMRELQYPLRGVADEVMLTRALAEIRDGQSFSICQLDCYPSEIIFRGGGDTHEELRTGLRECFGDAVAVGSDPLWYEPAWVKAHPDDIICRAKHQAYPFTSANAAGAAWLSFRDDMAA